MSGIISPPANQITMTDNEASAYRVFEGANDYLTIDTVDGSELITFGEDLQMDANLIHFVQGSHTASLRVPTANGTSGFTVDSNNNINLNTGTNLSVNVSDDLRVNSDKLFVDASAGKVGIGHDVPVTTLHVFAGTGSSGLTGIPSDRGIGITGGSGHSRLYLEDPDATSGERVCAFDNEAGFFAFSALSDTGGSFTNENMLVFDLNQGLVGVNEGDPEQALHVDGNILATGAFQMLVVANQAIAVGDLVKVSGSVDNRFVLSTTLSEITLTGVAESAAAGAGNTFHMAVGGLMGVRVNNTIARGDFLRASSVAGRAESAGTTAATGIFGRATESATAGNLCLFVRPFLEIF